MTQLANAFAALAADLTALQAIAAAPPPFYLFYPLPADVVYVPVKTYLVAPSGTPYTTAAQAIKQINADRASGVIPPASANAIACVSYQGGQTFVQDYTNSSITEDYVLFNSYGVGYAMISSPGVAFQKIKLGSPPANPRGLYIQYLNIVSTDTSATITYGVSVNQVDDVAVDYCAFNGFTFNVCCAWASNGVRYAFSYSERAKGVPGTESGTGFYCDQCTNVSYYGAFHFHEGWSEATYTPAWWTDVSTPAPHVASPANAALLQTLQYMHGTYLRDDTAWAPINVTDSVWVACASTGLQIRTSGTATRCIFAHNGGAPDSYVIGPSGGYDTCGLLGETTNDFDYWGQGIQVQVAAGFAKNILVVSDSPTTQNAAVSVLPPVLGEIGNGTVTPLTGVIPPTACVVDNIRGVWPQNSATRPSPVYVDPSLAGSTTVTNVIVRKPRAGEQVLTLPMIYGVQTDQQVADLWKANFRNWRNDSRFTAQYIYNAMSNWIGANP